MSAADLSPDWLLRLGAEAPDIEICARGGRIVVSAPAGRLHLPLSCMIEAGPLGGYRLVGRVMSGADRALDPDGAARLREILRRTDAAWDAAACVIASEYRIEPPGGNAITRFLDGLYEARGVFAREML